MPIRPELRHLYRGPEWEAQRAAAIKRAGGKCATCRASHPMLNGAHRNHDPRDRSSVVAWCPTCHARHDAPHRVAVMRRTRARLVGQLWLLPELEYAPDPFWMIPRAAQRGTQLGLFG